MRHIGEFDFLVAAEKQIILGESKWSHNGELRVDHAGQLELDSRQELRHRIFAVWCDAWWDVYSSWGNIARSMLNTERLNDDADTRWSRFELSITERSEATRVELRIPTRRGRVFENFNYIMQRVDSWFISPGRPKVRNLLLYVRDSEPIKETVKLPPNGFDLLVVDYSEAKMGEFVSIYGA